MSALDRYYERKKKRKSNQDLKTYKNDIDTDSEGKTAFQRYQSRKENSKNNDNRTWFTKGAFEDGYQFGDVLKTARGTAEDIGTNLLAGAAGIVEGAWDSSLYVAGGILGLFDERFKDITSEEIKKDVINEEKVGETLYSLASGGFVTDAIFGDIDPDEYSVLGEKSDSLVRSGGQLVAQAGLQAVGVPWWVTLGVTSFGSEVEKAFNEGATYGEAGISGLVTAGAEILTEKISGGIKFGGKALTDVVTDSFVRKISNKAVRTLTKLGFDAVGEGAEEILSGVMSAVGQKLTYANEKEFNELFSKEDAWESFIGGAVLSTTGGVVNYNKSKRTGVDFTSGLTANEEAVALKVYEDALKEAEKGNKKLTVKEKNELFDKTRHAMERGEISTDVIEEVLGGDDYTAYKKAFDSEAALKQEFEELGNKQNPTLAEQSRYAELKTQIEQLGEKSEADTLKGKMNDNVLGLINADGKKLKNSRGSYLAESYNEKSRRGQAYQVDLSLVEEKYQDTYKKAAESRILNDTRKTHEFVDMLAKLSADKGVSFDFTNNENLKNSGFAIDGKTVNGYITADGSITLNTQSQKYLNSVVGHEIMHVLEGTDLYDAFKTAVTEYAKTKGEYDSRLADITDLYQNIENADPEAELIADLVGDYLFTDEAFVRSLSTQNRNLFEKIFDEIKYLCKIVTSGSKEARELEKIKKVFSDVYRESGTAQKNTTENSGGVSVKYSLAANAKSELHKALYDKNYRNEVLLRDETPAIMLSQKGVINRQMVMNASHIRENVFTEDEARKLGLKVDEQTHYHGIGEDYFLKIVDSLDNVKEAYRGTKNANMPSRRENYFLLVSEFKDQNGNTINVPVYIEEGAICNKVYLTSNKIATVFGKDDFRQYINEQIKNKNLVRIKNKSSTFSEGGVPLTPAYESSALSDSILNSDENVKQKDVFGFKINENADVNEDLLEEISYFHPDAEVDERGNITVYHRTTKENAERIRQTSIMTAKEDALFFSSKESGYVSDYGDTVVKLKIPSTELRLNDVFDGEVHFDLPLKYKNGGYSLDVSKYLIKSNDYSNDIAPVKKSVSTDGEQAAKKYGDYAVSGEDVRLETRDDIAPLPENTEIDTEYPDVYAPIGEGVVEDDAEIDGIIKTIKDGLSQKRQNYETERKNLAVKQQETLSNIDDKIAEAQAKYDGKKNKDTRIANALFRRIENLKTRKANIEADYAKRLNNLDSRIQRINDLSQKDYTQVAEIEKAINRIDKILEIDKATLDEEFEKKKAEYANKNVFIGREAKKLYNELTNLKKGTRASKQLGYLLDLGYDWGSLKAALAHIDMSPAKLVNVNSDVEANVRLALDTAYDEKVAALDGEYRERLTQLETEAENQRKAAKTANQRRTKMDQLTAEVAELIGDTSTWVDKKLGLSYKVNTLRRNLRDIVRDEYGNRDIKKADAIYDYLQGTYNKHEAELNRESNRIKERFDKEKINSAESEYIMMLGELRENPETTLTEKDVGDFLEKHRNKIDTEKVDRVIEQWRKTADELFERVNTVLKNAGMKEIPYRKGYYFHFTEEQGKVAKFFEKALNWKTQNNEIPTDIAGLTEQFNPQRKWQSFDKQRKGDSTVYDFLRSADQYINGTLDWIYHIEDIQKRRAFENHIRYVHSEQGIKDKIDALRNSDKYDADELQKEIELAFKEAGNPLGNFVSDFRTGTNTLAGKKSSMDRGMEELTNRKFYSTMTNLSNRVSANMVGGSISSALTNFIPITQSWGQVSPLKSLNAMRETIVSYFKDDGVVNKSDFLTNRLRSADSLYKTTWDKIGDKAGLLMESIDNFTSQTVWRSKYNDNVSKGMSETAAIKDADQFAENVIAGRSRGNMPTIFDSKNPIIKTMTMFQLEVNNQYGYMFKDMPQDVKNNATKNLIKGYASMFAGAYAYNALFSALTGRDAAFDPIGIIEELLRDIGLFGDDDEEEPSDTILNLADNILEEVPFVSGLVGGGRVPISSALPYGEGVYEIFEGTVNDIAAGDWNSLTEEWLNPVTYLLPPVAGGQIKKSMQGLSMFNTDDDHPIAGSYTADGSLRYPVDDTIGNRIQAALFGRWANENARDYIEDGRRPLEQKQQQEFIDSGMSIQDYWEYREGLSSLKTLNEKADYIASLDLPTDTKNLLLNNVANRDEKIDLEEYESFTNFEEFDFANKNPEKYDFLQGQGITVREYLSFDEDTKAAYSWAAQHPEKYQVSRVVTDDVVKYKSYSKALSGIESDKDKNGKTISGSRKKKVVAYINDLDLDYGQKIILLKSEYASEDRYNHDIVEYLNNRDDISRSEMETILQELGFTVLADGTVKW